MIKRFLSFYLPMVLNFGKRLCLHMVWLMNTKLGRKHLVLETQQGRFKISTNDSTIGYSLFMHGQFEYDFSLKATEFLTAHGVVSPGGITFLDIGANIGIISIGLMRQAKIAYAIAVEPEPKNFELLVENVKLNHFENQIVCLPLALGDRRTVLSMEVSPDNPGDHRIQSSGALTDANYFGEERRKLVQVESIPLDELFDVQEVSNKGWSLSNSVLWIDVQGYEGFVFKGAKKFLSNGVPTVSEIWPYGILRAGMTLMEFTVIVSSIWSDYWVLRGERFIRYPIAMFDRYLDEIGEATGNGNVIFTKS